MSTDRYTSPLSERYASKEMQYIFSQDMKFRTWRRLWIALAETEKELGLNITQEQIDELKAHADDINYDVAKAREKEVRHDVMSHVYAYGVQCPKAKGIIHLGATSCYVGDNTDIIIMTEAMKLVKKRLVNVINELSKFAMKYKDIYIQKINAVINKDWSFDRLGYVEQAILLMACCELDLETAQKAIVIDEAITLAKKYCDDDAYKLINGVLDRL